MAIIPEAPHSHTPSPEGDWVGWWVGGVTLTVTLTVTAPLVVTFSLGNGESASINSPSAKQEVTQNPVRFDPADVCCPAKIKWESLRAPWRPDHLVTGVFAPPVKQPCFVK